MNLSSLVIPVLLAGVAACGLGRRVDVYAALTHGAEEGLGVLLRIVPALVGLLTAVSMFRASGAMDTLSSLLAPALEALGIPSQTAPLLLIRPVSGSGALAVGTDLMTTYGPDSYIGRVAGHHPHPPCHSRRPAGGPDRLRRLCLRGAAVLRDMTRRLPNSGARACRKGEHTARKLS